MTVQVRASREQVLGALSQRDWATAAEVADALALPEHRTIEVLRTLNELRDEDLVLRSTASASESPLVYWAVVA